MSADRRKDAPRHACVAGGLAGPRSGETLRRLAGAGFDGVGLALEGAELVRPAPRVAALPDELGLERAEARR
jgi:hypothetical protein